jgi:copper(I)-binding protein
MAAARGVAVPHPRQACSMKAALAVIFLAAHSAQALAHGYRFGALEILHPAIMVPSQQTDCSCAHLKIINHGANPEYFLGAEIAIATRTHLVSISSAGSGLSMPTRVKIAAGGTLDLNRHEWCLFMSGITASLEADVGTVPATLRFANQGTVHIEFLIDEAPY